MRLTMLYLFALLVGCGAAPARPRPAHPPGARGDETEGASTDPPADVRFVALRSFVQMCGLTSAGDVECWGFALLPGHVGWTATPTPTTVAGLGRVAGFSLPTARSLVAWDGAGAPSTVSMSTAHTEVELRSGIEVLSPDGRLDPRPRHIAEGRGRCLRTVEGELLCIQEADNRPTFHAGSLVLRSLAPGGYCGVDEGGAVHGFYVTSGPDPAWQVETMALPQDPRLLFCGRTDEGIEGCTVGGEGVEDDALRCTSRALTERVTALVGDRRVTGFSLGYAFDPCVHRDDGSVRCATTFPSQERLLDGLPNLDGRDGGQVAAAGDVACALDWDGVVQCWGARELPTAGEVEVTDATGEPRHLSAYDGALRISADGGVTCVQSDEEHARCFGGPASQRMDPEPFALPEPIDVLEGGYVHCVHGVSGEWYCRDLTRTTFRGHLAGGWARLEDRRGRRLGARIRSVGVSWGSGVIAVGDDGEARVFFESARSQPFRLVPYPRLGEDLRAVFGVRDFVRTDGSATLYLDQFYADSSTVQGPVTEAYDGCVLTADGRASCLDLETGEMRVAVDDVVQLDRAMLRRDGSVYVREGQSWRARHDLPPMRQVAGSCGISRTGEVWCSGPLRETDLPVFSTTLRPITPSRP